MYLAHHFSDDEIVFDLERTGYKIVSHRITEFASRTDNTLDAFVIVAEKQ